MIYRTLGRTGLQVSQLGFGAMRLPMARQGEQDRINRELAVPMIHRAFEAGVNYIDSAVVYGDGDSEEAVGEALKGWRDKIIVSTKNHCFGASEKEWRGHLDDSLRRLGIDCIDMYHHHAISWECFEKDIRPRVSAWMAQAKREGLIRHICVSFHDNNDALRKVIDADYADVITLQYNLLDRQLEDGIAYAHAKGIGVVVMGPVGGGRLGEPSEALMDGAMRTPELALRFVLANPYISVALSGMSTMEQVGENLQIAKDPVALRPENRKAIEARLEHLKKLSGLYCTGCGYCMPCPQGVEISDVFDAYNRGRVYGLWNSARHKYRHVHEKGHAAAACAECGACEPKCPQHIPIRERLKEAEKALAWESERSTRGHTE